MRKFLRQKFWSHGTPLGSLGPGSFEDLGPGFGQCQIPLIWGPYEYPVLVACHVQAEKLKSIPSRCDIFIFSLTGVPEHSVPLALPPRPGVFPSHHHHSGEASLVGADRHRLLQVLGAEGHVHRDTQQVGFIFQHYFEEFAKILATLIGCLQCYR